LSDNHPLRTNCPICPKEGKPRRKYSDFWGHLRTEHGMTKVDFINHPDYKNIRVHDNTTTPYLKRESVLKPTRTTNRSYKVFTISNEDIEKVIV